MKIATCRLAAAGKNVFDIRNKQITYARTYLLKVGEGRSRTGDDGEGEGVREQGRARADHAERAGGRRGALHSQSHRARSQPLLLVSGLAVAGEHKRRRR